MSDFERSSNQKHVDAIFSSVPFGYATSDTGLHLKYLDQINKKLDKHRESIDRSLAMGASSPPMGNRVPDYLPTPEIVIDTSELAHAQRDVADALGSLFDSQRDLLGATREHTPLFQRMVRNQGVSQFLHMQTNDLLHSGNKMASQAALEAFHQRNQQMEQLSEIISGQTDIVHSINGVGQEIAGQSEKTRELLGYLLTDVGDRITMMGNEQVITRIALLQSLYSIRSTFLQNHEQQILSAQQQTGLLQNILQAAHMTEREKESRYLWRKAERTRKTAKTNEEYQEALSILKAAHELDDINPSAYLSIGTIQSALGNAELASSSFAEADLLVENDPHLSSYILINLGNSLMTMKHYPHAERVLRKATRLDVSNREVWFRYGKAAWLSGKKENAIKVMQNLLKLNPAYYKAQIAVDSELSALATHLFKK